ncbi:unnamed protein product [Thlaspi arvense]|uniref:Uncharacterized protein n=1 Tax=Thlaspi arvense TaxID=13288 RepID=A0AAU9RTY1_THLAR|nr:unnamed protein product [Thlaspi arvense]
MKLIPGLPSPLSLFYAILVCLLLAVVFTNFKPPITTSIDGDFTIPPLQTTIASAATTTTGGATAFQTHPPPLPHSHLGCTSLALHALLEDPSNSMFALLSSSCIPLRSFNFTYKTLIWPKKSFIELLKNEPGAYDRWAARGKYAMLPEVPFENFRIGSQFFVLTHEHARMIVSDSKLWSKFRLLCLKKSICYPEEQYFPTLISRRTKWMHPINPYPRRLQHQTARAPRMYRASEVRPDLIAAVRSKRPRYGDDGPNGSSSLATKRKDPFLFARKFSADSIQPLLRIALDVIFKD